MNRAWRIARQGAKEFGGSPAEYLSVSLKMAWAEEKAIAERREHALDIQFGFDWKKSVIESTGRKSTKQWVAKVNGLDSKFGFKREFVGQSTKVEEGGIYNWTMNGDQIFGQYQNGRMVYLLPEQVEEIFEAVA